MTTKNDDRKQQHRAEREVIAELESLSQNDGFIYTFCGLVLNSLFMSPDEVADFNWDQRLNVQELAFPLGIDGQTSVDFDNSLIPGKK